MAVFKILSPCEFEQEFRDFGRDYYSKEAYSFLYDLLDSENAELDVISVCCDWTESDANELWGDYGYMVGGGELTDDGLSALIDALEARTTVVRLGNSHYLIASF